jgi:acyl carrier protein
VTEQRDLTPARGDDVAEALLEVVRDLVADIRPAHDGRSVRLDSRLDADLGLDSLAVAELLVRLEHRFAITLPEQVLAHAETPRDLLDALADGSASTSERSAAPSARLDWGDRPSGPTLAPGDAATLLDVLDWHVETHPDLVHLRLLAESGRGPVELTYAELRQRAADVAAGLRQRGTPPGTAVAVMLPTSEAYFTTFLGILLAGCIPTPIYPPARPSGLEEHLRRHVRILDNAQATALVTVPEVRPLARLLTAQVASLRQVVTPEDLVATGQQRPRARPAAGDTALLQYTSGSTGDPKGVVLSHANLLANIRAMIEAGQVVGTDVFVSWLPLYHDMGLIGSWLLSLTAGIPFVVMSPLSFLGRPVRWLQAIHEHGGTLSGGPNFGYELCLKRVDDADLAGLDLRSWRIAFNGAEPVSPDTVARFTARFAQVGLSPGAMTPVYGLAESAVALTIPPVGRGPVIDEVDRAALGRNHHAAPADPADPNPARIVACGTPLRGHEVRIVDRQGTRLVERLEGRVQFRGPSATAGYHRNPAATGRLLRDGWLETGDLGYLADGELHVTGRVKDLIIRAGRNLHPAELEEAVGRLDDVRQGCVAAFAATDEASGTERLVVVAETRVTDERERGRLREAVTEVVTDVVGSPPDEVVLAGPGAVPKTSSGKIRRAATRERYEAGELRVGHRPVWWQLARLAGTGVMRRASRSAAASREVAFGIYARALFTILAAVTAALLAVVPGADRRWRLVRRAGWVLFRAAGVPIELRGEDHLPPQGPYVVAANHASFLDPLVLTMVLPERAVFVAIGGLADNPLVRFFLRRMDTQLVGRGDRRRALEDRRALTELARSGRVVAFFPEGRRSPAPGLEPFRSGAFLVAVDADVPVVPVALRGTRRLLPVGRSLPRRSSITVTIAWPVVTDETGWSGAMELLRHTRAEILRHCGEPDLA